ncbi:hypothetical protein GGX14DRAFT_647454 [Mycena pura]|uniref:Uncharacterized protein n=1 Tax=Mycena pura TaxID=153505 RepID=A0AAD6Y9L5_9AGAR|nr:hypothetical protein GGX14DRAFT_647454 [Mycena pura]
MPTCLPDMQIGGAVNQGSITRGSAPGPVYLTVIYTGKLGQIGPLRGPKAFGLFAATLSGPKVVTREAAPTVPVSPNRAHCLRLTSFWSEGPLVGLYRVHNRMYSVYNGHPSMLLATPSPKEAPAPESDDKHTNFNKPVFLNPSMIYMMFIPVFNPWHGPLLGAPDYKYNGLPIDCDDRGQFHLRKEVARVRHVTLRGTPASVSFPPLGIASMGFWYIGLTEQGKNWREKVVSAAKIHPSWFALLEKSTAQDWTIPRIGGLLDILSNMLDRNEDP